MATTDFEALANRIRKIDYELRWMVWPTDETRPREGLHHHDVESFGEVRSELTEAWKAADPRRHKNPDMTEVEQHLREAYDVLDRIPVWRMPHESVVARADALHSIGNLIGL